MTNQIDDTTTTINTTNTELEQRLAASLDHKVHGWAGSLHSELTSQIIGAAIEVHKHVGPGQLEALYQRALACELRRRGLAFRAQAPIPMLYKGEPIGDYFADLVIEGKVIVELKAVDALRPVHTAQILAYLRGAKLELGLLINFNMPTLKQGVRRLILARRS
jgi:GxxExxY protein